MSNETVYLILIIGSSCIGGGVVYFLLRKSYVGKDMYQNENIEKTQRIAELNTKLNLTEESKLELTKEKDLLTAKLDEAHQVYQDTKNDVSKLQLRLESQQEKLDKQEDSFKQTQKESLVQFENLANRLFDEKTEKFSKESKSNIEQLLNPLKENISDFKKKVEETYDKESKERHTLESKIQDLVMLNEQISKDATNLTNALKGQSKTQGDWGEMILESILDHSGLVKGREYFVQETFQDESGKNKRPDVTIKYPDNRYIIIDSKVSLTAFERYVNEENTDSQKVHLQTHIRSIKNHIDNLSGKEYEKRDKALDFVFLFIPIEPAFLTALQADDQLWNYAYKKRIVLMSPTNLLATLRVIADVWSKEIQNQNAREISKRGEHLLEKFVGFVNDMEDIEKHLNKVDEKYSDAMKKLSTGSGNLIGQAQKLKQLGVTSKKQLSEKYGLDDDASI